MVGIIVGVRTLTNGETEWVDEGLPVYKQTEQIQAYLIAWDMHRKHVRVRVEDVQEVGEW